MHGSRRALAHTHTRWRLKLFSGRVCFVFFPFSFSLSFALIESQAAEGVGACLHCSDSVGVGKPSETAAAIKDSAQNKKTLLANVHLLLPVGGRTEARRGRSGRLPHVLMDEADATSTPHRLTRNISHGQLFTQAGSGSLQVQRR